MLQPVLAVVTFQGVLGALGDTTECTSTVFDDNELADLLALENSYVATRDRTTFHYPVDLTCGKDYATGIAVSCAGLGGRVTCNQNLLPRSRIMRQASQQLGKRGAFYCKDASQKCDNTVNANIFGNCPSGYTSEIFKVKGQVPGIFCSKPCTAAQLNECLGSVCEYRRRQCSMYPGSCSICGDALIKCRTLGPVSMQESICNDDLIPKVPFTNSTGGISYVNGQCSLNNTEFEALTKSSKEIGKKLLFAVFDACSTPPKQGSRPEQGCS